MKVSNLPKHANTHSTALGTHKVFSFCWHSTGQSFKVGQNFASQHEDWGQSGVQWGPQQKGEMMIHCNYVRKCTKCQRFQIISVIIKSKNLIRRWSGVSLRLGTVNNCLSIKVRLTQCPEGGRRLRIWIADFKKSNRLLSVVLTAGLVNCCQSFSFETLSIERAKSRFFSKTNIELTDL